MKHTLGRRRLGEGTHTLPFEGVVVGGAGGRQICHRSAHLDLGKRGFGPRNRQ